MKKLFYVALLAVFVVPTAVTFAAVDVCSNIDGDQDVAPKGFITKLDGTCVVAPSNGDPMAVMQPWGLSGHDTPTVRPGDIVTDEGGISDVCPKWYAGGCSNLTHTSYYRNAWLATARQLKANGFAVQFPQFKYWLDQVK